MNDCLATTGSASLIPFAVIAGLMLIAGLAAIFIAKKRAGWAALAIVPLLLVAGVFAGASPSAQAACPTSSPSPTASCTPVTPLVGVTIEDTWFYVNDEDLYGFDLSWDPETSEDAQALIEASTGGPTLPGTVTASFRYWNGEGFVVQEVIFAAPINVADEDPTTLFFTPYDGWAFIPMDLLNDAYDGDGSLFALDVVITVPYDDGCGTALTTSITLTGDAISPS